MKKAVVLGGGGVVGMGYHAGALKALDEIGVDPHQADIIVGTSAGAIISAYLAAGWRTDDFYEYAHGRHRDAVADEDSARREIRGFLEPLWATRPERVRRSVGSLFALASSRGLWRGGAQGRTPPARLRRAFPSGLYSTERSRERFFRDLPSEWPRSGVYLCAADLYSGKRVPFGHATAPEALFPEAVLASTAIPGFFAPVRIGERYYVDGGVVSATSLDLAVDAGCEIILCIAPLGYRAEGAFFTTDPRLWAPMAMRQFFARSLRKEVNDARARGVKVLVVRPWLDELKALGTNAMRDYDRATITDAARVGTLRLIERNRDHPVLRAFSPDRTKERAG